MSRYAEFLDWRLGGLGSSDAATVMCASPWMDPKTLWEILTEKRGYPEKTFPMKRGLAAEPIARQCYSEMLGFRVVPRKRKHKKFPVLRASFDATNFEKKHLGELKAPGIHTHALALLGQIPWHYIWQLVHQMAVSDLPSMDYFSFYSWRKIPDGFVPENVPAFEIGKKSAYLPPSYKQWSKIPKQLIWERDYLDDLSDDGGVTDFLNLGDLNFQKLKIFRDKKVEERLIERALRFWEFVQKDIPPTKKFMEEDKPKLRLVPPPIEMEKPKQKKRKRVEVFQVRSSEAMKANGDGGAGRPKIGRPTYTAKEVIEMMEKARELGVRRLVIDGVDFEMRGHKHSPSDTDDEESSEESEEPQQNSEPRRRVFREDPDCSRCGSPMQMGNYGHYYCRPCYLERKPRRRFRRNYY